MEEECEVTVEVPSHLDLGSLLGKNWVDTLASHTSVGSLGFSECPAKRKPVGGTGVVWCLAGFGVPLVAHLGRFPLQLLASARIHAGRARQSGRMLASDVFHCCRLRT